LTGNPCVKIIPVKEVRNGRRRLKIAIVIDAYDGCKNGAAISTKRFVDLLRREHDIFLITTGDPAPGKTVLPKLYVPFVRGVMKRMNTPLALPLSRKLTRIFREVDLIHVQFPFLLAIRSVSIALKLRVPIVTTFHIQAEHLAMNAGITASWFITGCYRVWMNYIYNPADLVICPSKFAEEELRRYGLTSPTVVISNGILPEYKPVASLRNKDWDGKFIVLSVGRFAPEKGHKMIIRAVNASKYRDRIQLILIGEGPMKEMLQQLGEALPNKPVFLTLPAEELIYYYNIADLYLHAASIEVEGMTVLEAMACGLPLLVANSPKSAAAQFALDQNSLFNCSEIGDLIKKLEFWVENPFKLKQAREQYSVHSLKYGISHSYEQLVDQYYRVMNERGTNKKPESQSVDDETQGIYNKRNS